MTKYSLSGKIVDGVAAAIAVILLTIIF